MAVNNKYLLSFMEHECHGLIYSTEQSHLWFSYYFFFLWDHDPWPPLTGLRDHTRTGRTTHGRTLLDEWSPRRGDLFTWQPTTLKDRYPCPPGWIRTCSPSRRAAAIHALALGATGISIFRLISHSIPNQPKRQGQGLRLLSIWPFLLVVSNAGLWRSCLIITFYQESCLR